MVATPSRHFDERKTMGLVQQLVVREEKSPGPCAMSSSHGTLPHSPASPPGAVPISIAEPWEISPPLRVVEMTHQGTTLHEP
jgi:hypothetical protein